MFRTKLPKCPNCGANIGVPPTGDWAVCRYCGANVYVHRGPRTVAVPVAGVPVVHVATSSPGLVIGLTLGGLGVVFVVALVIAFATNGVDVLSNVALIGMPVAMDVDGDGDDDALIMSIHPGAEVMFVGAYDGTSGKELWSSDALLRSGEREIIAGYRDVVLLARDATISGVDAKTGKTRFTVTPPERPSAFCDVDGALTLLADDGKLYPFDARTGQIGNPGAPPGSNGKLQPRPDCHVVASDGNRDCGSGNRTLQAYELRKSEGMRISNVIEQPDHTTFLLLGTRPGASTVPMIGARTAERVLWQADVAPSAPLSAAAGPPPTGAILGERAYVGYEKAGHEQAVVVAVELGTGRRLWETELPINDASSMFAVSASARHVFVFTTKGNDGTLRSLDAATGALEWRRGGAK
jgi:hypothetical protein